MAQGEFTVEEATEMEKAVGEMFEALPKSKKAEYLGHLNDIYLFISAAKNHLKEESTTSQAKE